MRRRLRRCTGSRRSGCFEVLGSAPESLSALKDLALAVSKIFKTAAICTSLYDSDTFECVVFNAGKQVDFVMTNPEHTAALSRY